MAEKKFLKAIGLTVLLTLVGFQALAGYIRIIPKQDVKVTLQGDQVKIEGTYEVANDGNDSALKVFPKIEIDKWLFVGEPVDLKPQTSHQWKFSEVKNKAEVFADNLDNPRGQWAAKVERSYTDLNNYPYVVQDLFMVQIGDSFTSPERLAMQSPKVKSQISLENKSYGGAGKWSVQNTSDTEVKVSLMLLVAKEFKVEGLPKDTLTLSPQEKKQGTLRVNNETALPGSNYNVTLLLSYFDPADKVQVAQASTALLNITAAKAFSFSWVWIGALAIAILAIAGFFWFSPKRR